MVGQVQTLEHRWTPIFLSKMSVKYFHLISTINLTKEWTKTFSFSLLLVQHFYSILLGFIYFSKNNIIESWANDRSAMGKATLTLFAVYHTSVRSFSQNFLRIAIKVREFMQKFPER